MSKDPVQRIEVFTGTGRRRWSEAEKLQIVAESYEPGTSASEVARRHGLSAPQLFAWRRLLGGEARRNADPLRFVPIAVGERAAVAHASEITIELCGAVVRVPRGADATTLRAVVEALRAPA